VGKLGKVTESLRHPVVVLSIYQAPSKKHLNSNRIEKTAPQTGRGGYEETALPVRLASVGLGSRRRAKLVRNTLLIPSQQGPRLLFPATNDEAEGNRDPGVRP
jgi:hypothetical protein